MHLFAFARRFSQPAWLRGLVSGLTAHELSTRVPVELDEKFGRGVRRVTVRVDPSRDRAFLKTARPEAVGGRHAQTRKRNLQVHFLQVHLLSPEALHLGVDLPSGLLHLGVVFQHLLPVRPIDRLLRVARLVRLGPREERLPTLAVAVGRSCKGDITKVRLPSGSTYIQPCARGGRGRAHGGRGRPSSALRTDEAMRSKPPRSPVQSTPHIKIQEETRTAEACLAQATTFGGSQFSGTHGEERHDSEKNAQHLTVCMYGTDKKVNECLRSERVMA